MLGPTLTRWAPSLQPPTTPPTTPTTPSPAEHEFSAIAKAKLPVVDLGATRFALAEPWSVILAAGGAGFRQALDRPRCQGPPLAIRLLRLTLQTASLAAAGACARAGGLAHGRPVGAARITKQGNACCHGERLLALMCQESHRLHSRPLPSSRRLPSYRPAPARAHRTQPRRTSTPAITRTPGRPLSPRPEKPLDLPILGRPNFADMKLARSRA